MEEPDVEAQVMLERLLALLRLVYPAQLTAVELDEALDDEEIAAETAPQHEL